MSKPWLLVSPASRGIGLQLARCLLETTDLPVIATARKDLRSTSEQILDGLDVDRQRLEVLNVDVTGTLMSRISFNVYLLIDLLHQMKVPSQMRRRTANLVSHPATSVSLSVSLVFSIPRSPPPKSTTPRPCPPFKSTRSVPCSSRNILHPCCHATLRPSIPFPVSHLPQSLP